MNAVAVVSIYVVTNRASYLKYDVSVSVYVAVVWIQDQATGPGLLDGLCQTMLLVTSSRQPIPSAQLLENQMKHNQHVMTWLGALRDEASLPGCELGRILEIAAIVARYAFGTGSI